MYCWQVCLNNSLYSLFPTLATKCVFLKVRAHKPVVVSNANREGEVPRNIIVMDISICHSFLPFIDQFSEKIYRATGTS